MKNQPDLGYTARKWQTWKWGLELRTLWVQSLSCSHYGSWRTWWNSWQKCGRLLKIKKQGIAHLFEASCSLLWSWTPGPTPTLTYHMPEMRSHIILDGIWEVMTLGIRMDTTTLILTGWHCVIWVEAAPGRTNELQDKWSHSVSLANCICFGGTFCHYKTIVRTCFPHSKISYWNA